MNIDNLFFNAKRSLDIARGHVDEQNYETAMVSISHVMSHTRALIEQIYKLQNLKAEVSDPAGENTP